MAHANRLDGWIQANSPGLAAVAVNVAATAILLRLDAGPTVAAIVYLVLIVWCATVTEQAVSIALAVLSALLFDYFFLPPRRSLTIDGFQSWFSMLAFLASCLVVARVAERARRQTKNADRRREDVESLNSLGQEMMLHGDALGLIRDIPRLVEQVFGLEMVLLYVEADDRTYSSVPGGSADGNAADAIADGMQVELVFGMKSVGTLALRPAKLSREVANSVAAQVAIAITRAHAIEDSTRLEAARSADRLRTALIDSLTHELRTPLTAIRAAATTLVGGSPLDEEVRQEMVTIVDEESARLDDLIGEAMEMARIDSDGVQVRAEQVWMGTFLEEAVEQVRAQLGSRRLSIVVENGEHPVFFDPRLVGRVIHHLLENAARHTPQSSRIVLRSRLGGDRIEISVEDDGPGIDGRDLSSVFEKFYRGKGAVGKGSGMGLAICRSIVTAHGGEIRVESMPGRGTAFRFWLPVGVGSGRVAADGVGLA